VQTGRALPSYSCRELALLLSGCVRLDVKPEGPWLQKALDQLEGQLGSQATPLDCSMLAYTLARLRALPSQTWLASFLGRSLAHMPGFSPQQLANLAWGLGVLNVQPEAAWLSQLCAAAVALQGNLDAAEKRQLGYGLVVMTRHQPQMLSALACQSQANSSLFSDLAASCSPARAGIAHALTEAVAYARAWRHEAAGMADQRRQNMQLLKEASPAKSSSTGVMKPPAQGRRWKSEGRGAPRARRGGQERTQSAGVLSQRSGQKRLLGTSGGQPAACMSGLGSVRRPPLLLDVVRSKLAAVYAGSRSVLSRFT
jgi:hypothetical protein